jgi:hypothetical protein
MTNTAPTVREIIDERLASTPLPVLAGRYAATHLVTAISDKNLILTRKKSSFGGHLFLTVITLGGWLLVWVPLALYRSSTRQLRFYVDIDGKTRKA